MKLIKAVVLFSSLLISLSASRVSGAVFIWQQISAGSAWDAYDSSSGTLTYNDGVITGYSFEVHSGPSRLESLGLGSYVASILPNGDLSLRTYSFGYDYWSSPTGYDPSLTGMECAGQIWAGVGWVNAAFGNWVPQPTESVPDSTSPLIAAAMLLPVGIQGLRRFRAT